jgi:hypothetical protein
MRVLRGFLTALLLIAPWPVALAADSAAIRQAVEEFLRMQVRNLPGNPVPIIGKIDAERLAGSCDGFNVSMNGPRRWGATPGGGGLPRRNGQAVRAGGNSRGG